MSQWNHIVAFPTTSQYEGLDKTDTEKMKVKVIIKLDNAAIMTFILISQNNFILVRKL